MNMKLIYIVFTLVAAQSSYASNDELKQQWHSLDTALVDYHFNNKRVRLPDIRMPSTCVDNEGSDISQEKCDQLREFVMGPGKTSSAEQELKNDDCINAVQHNQLLECRMRYDEKSKSSVQEQQKRVDAISELAIRTIPRFTEMLKARVASNLKTIDAVVKHLADPSEKKKAIVAKKNSKACKVYHVTADICRKAYVEAAANKGLKVEDEATKQSGAVNVYSRYKLGQMKALHGTTNLPQLKKQYRELLGTEWTPKTCEASPEVKRKAASGEINDESEEIEACGCHGLDCADTN